MHCCLVAADLAPCRPTDQLAASLFSMQLLNRVKKWNLWSIHCQQGLGLKLQNFHKRMSLEKRGHFRWSPSLGANFPEIETNFGRHTEFWDGVELQPRQNCTACIWPIQLWIYLRSIVDKTHLFLNFDQPSSSKKHNIQPLKATLHNTLHHSLRNSPTGFMPVASFCQF